MKTVLDTNFMVDCVRFKIDLEKELAGNELFITDSIRFELGVIAKKRTRHSGLAKTALEYIERKSLKTLGSDDKETDLSLLRLSKDGYAIATNDRALRVSIKKQGGKVMFIRQKKYVVLE
jgi:rRNA-processing protein FCF1